jgi:hypothetical protein
MSDVHGTPATEDYSGLPAVAPRSPSTWLFVVAGVVVAVPLLYVAVVLVIVLHGPVAKL